jgi:hypothetical protein
MVRSTENYDLWKKEFKQMYLSKFPSKEKQIDKFMDYVGDRYDSLQRSYIPRKVLWYLYYKKRRMIKGQQHFWIAFIGRKGGEGKSTLAHNCFHFLDGTYNPGRASMNYEELLKSIVDAKKVERYPCVLLDEPENKTHQLSLKGREIRDILERIRQLNLFVGICANSLTSIPSFIYERLSAIVFINEKHRFYLWDSAKDEPKCTIVDDIKSKEGWGMYRHGVFKQPKITQRAHFKNLGFSKETPFEMKEYLKKKEGDLIGDIDGFLSVQKARKATIKHPKEKLKQEIMKLKKKNPNITDIQIALRLGYTREYINKLKNECE